MARILLHTVVFAPDGVSTAVLLSELMQDLQADGHKITILTTQPHNNREADGEATQPLHKRLFGLYYVSDHLGMRVIHTYMPRKGENLNRRMRHYLVFHFLSLWLGIFMLGRQDVVIVPSPPLTIGMIGWMLAKLKGARFIYNVRELYPALAVQMGLMKTTSSLYRILAWMERFVYNRSWVVVVICEQFRRYVISTGIATKKVLNIPDFVDIDFIHPQPKDNPLARELGLVDKYVVLYAGNIGMTQSFDTLLPVMERLTDIPDIHLLIVGDGARRTYVEEQISLRKLTNTTCLPYQPRHVVPNIYATADLGLVPLMAGTAQTTIPSKIYTILASGRPALVSVDPDSELVWIVDEAKCGLAVPPDDIDALEAGIRTAYTAREQFRTYGVNGRHYVEAHFSRRAVNQQFNLLMQQLVADKH